MASNLGPKPSIAMDHSDSMAEGDVDHLEVPGVNAEIQLNSLFWGPEVNSKLIQNKQQVAFVQNFNGNMNF